MWQHVCNIKYIYYLPCQIYIDFLSKSIVIFEFCIQIIRLFGNENVFLLTVICVLRIARRAFDCVCHSLCCWWLATGCAEGFVSCLQVHRGGWVHLSVVLLSAFCVDGIPSCIRFPNSSCVYLFYMISVVVTYPLLFHIRVYFVERVMHRLIMDCWFLCTLYVLYVLRNII
jgi:hypothetical protein